MVESSLEVGRHLICAKFVSIPLAMFFIFSAFPIPRATVCIMFRLLENAQIVVGQHAATNGAM